MIVLISRNKSFCQKKLCVYTISIKGTKNEEIKTDCVKDIAIQITLKIAHSDKANKFRAIIQANWDT